MPFPQPLDLLFLDISYPGFPDHDVYNAPAHFFFLLLNDCFFVILLQFFVFPCLGLACTFHQHIVLSHFSHVRLFVIPGLSVHGIFQASILVVVVQLLSCV